VDSTVDPGPPPGSTVASDFRAAPDQSSGCVQVGSVRSADVKILVVEDEVRVAAALKRGLEADGYAVDVAGTGTEGLWRAEEGDYAAIVLDIMLPELNGFRVCATLRERGDWTPVLMLTAKDGELDEAEALDTGADDFVRKPFSYVVLVARLRALLRRGGRDRPAVLEAGDLHLDPATHAVSRGDTAIRLTAREVSVLEFLLRRKGEVVSKSEILDQVWDYDFIGDSNVVEVYASRLRQKIDVPFGRNAIETIRGAGYRLAADGG
jgi:two-component system OmpR family response regulator